MSTKETISSCAANLFRKKGFPATSMRDIADSVGIKAASIYNHYKSKQILLEELLMDVAHQFTRGMEIIKKKDLPAVEKLKLLIDLHVRISVEHTDASALITGEWVHLTPVTRAEYLKLRDKYEADFRIIIEEAKKEGFFPDIDIDIAVFSILSTLRWLYSWYNRHTHFKVEDLQQQMKLVLIK